MSDPRSNSTDAEDVRARAIADSMAAAPDWYERLNGLRDDVHFVLADEFRFVAGDLEQLRGMLGDAAGKLSQAFRDMTQASLSIKEAARTMDPKAAQGDVAPFIANAERIAETSTMTIQSLQFEDMASQLLAHVSRRLDILEAFSKDMTMLVPSPTGRPMPTTREALDQLELRIADYRAELEAAKRKSVQQQTLDAGGIELF